MKQEMTQCLPLASSLTAVAQATQPQGTRREAHLDRRDTQQRIGVHQPRVPSRNIAWMAQSAVL
jgi:hypothetical protein